MPPSLLPGGACFLRATLPPSALQALPLSPSPSTCAAAGSLALSGASGAGGIASTAFARAAAAALKIRLCPHCHPTGAFQ